MIAVNILLKSCATAAGELTHGLHLLRLSEFFLQLAFGGRVQRVDHRRLLAGVSSGETKISDGARCHGVAGGDPSVSPWLAASSNTTSTGFTSPRLSSATSIAP